MKKNPNKIRRRADEKALHVISVVLITIFTLMCLYPFWNVFINSIATKEEAARGVYFFPEEPTFSVYADVLRDGKLLHSLLISVSRTVLSTVGCVLFSAMFAYLMTQQNLPCRKVIYRFAIITMYVSGGLIPWYLVMKLYGMYNSFWVYVLPNLLGVYYCILIKTFIEGLPTALEEAARIDGANEWQIFFHVILPLVKPALGTVVTFGFIMIWDQYLLPLIVVNQDSLNTIPVILGTLRTDESITPNIFIAITLLAMLPSIIVYLGLQKHFNRGIMSGAVKG